MDLSELQDRIDNKYFSGAAIDSRQIKESQVFFALKGEKVDGHLFLQEAKCKGAEAAVVSKGYLGDDYGLILVRVDDVLQSLQTLAKKVFKKRNTKVLGVTGSVGKTTIKEFIATLLEEKFCLMKTPGTYNSQATFPLCIVNSPGEEELFVMEMGMSLPGELARLVDIAPPDIAFVGRVALAHAASFSDGLEGIAREKAQILSHPKTRIAILHAETSRLTPFCKTQKRETFVYGDEEFFLEAYDNGWRVVEKGMYSPVFSLPFVAAHLRENFLGATAVARALGMQWEEILSRISQLKLVSRRFQEVEKEGVLYINDAYNANPASMRAALENLPRPQGGKKIGVLGEMRELGRFSKVSHYEIGELALSCVDELLCFGEECLPMVEVFAKEGRSAQFFTDLVELKRALDFMVKPGDVVLIKGSNSKQMWTLLE
ncbi:MAG: UDP-N-acetylmuramoyl-tripeptide--D-alanyl-D-alanine ligase [Chlamydiota bacterium]